MEEINIPKPFTGIITKSMRLPPLSCNNADWLNVLPIHEMVTVYLYFIKDDDSHKELGFWMIHLFAV